MTLHVTHDGSCATGHTLGHCAPALEATRPCLKAHELLGFIMVIHYGYFSHPRLKILIIYDALHVTSLTRLPLLSRDKLKR